MSSLKKSLPLAAVIGAGLVLAAPAAQANLLVNGSFEDPVFDRDFTELVPSRTISGWELHSLDPVRDTLPMMVNTDYLDPDEASDGKQFVYLKSYNSQAIHSLRQSFNTVIGQTYQVKYDFSPIPHGLQIPEAPEIYSSGSVFISDPNAVDGNAFFFSGYAIGSAVGSAQITVPVWQRGNSFNFTAISTTTNIDIAAINYYGFNELPQPENSAFSNEALFDNVSVDAVVATPEPQTWAMMGIGLAALVFMGWKRRKQSAESAVAANGLLA